MNPLMSRNKTPVMPAVVEIRSFVILVPQNLVAAVAQSIGCRVSFILAVSSRGVEQSKAISQLVASTLELHQRFRRS